MGPTEKSLPRADLDIMSAGLSSLWPELREQHVFITGGTGFIGKWLISALLDANTRQQLRLHLTVLSRDPNRFRVQYPHVASDPAISLIEGDVSHFTFPSSPCQVIIHAATDVVVPGQPQETFDTCVIGTRRVLDLAARNSCKKFLLLSSGAVYGRQPDDLLRIPETYNGSPDPTLPTSAYGIGKLAAEWLTHTYAQKHGFTATVARCFAFVGPYLPLDKQFAIGNFIRDALSGDTIHIKGDGTPYRSYLYAADLVVWLLTLMLRGEQATTLNVGGDEALSIGQLAARVVHVLGSASSIDITTQARADSIPSRYLPDVSKAAAQYDLRPTIGLDEAILRTAHWHQRKTQP